MPANTTHILDVTSQVQAILQERQGRPAAAPYVYVPETPEPHIDEFMIRVCGPDYHQQTYGVRDAKIVARAKELGWDLGYDGAGSKYSCWGLSKTVRRRNNVPVTVMRFAETMGQVVDFLVRVERMLAFSGIDLDPSLGATR